MNNEADNHDPWWTMEANDYWSHVGLVVTFLAVVIAPRLLSPGHAVNSAIYLTGAAVVLAGATAARRRTRSRDATAVES